MNIKTEEETIKVTKLYLSASDRIKLTNGVRMIINNVKRESRLGKFTAPITYYNRFLHQLVSKLAQKAFEMGREYERTNKL